MDKRKGIILAIVLFLIIGLGSFVFAGQSDEFDQENGTKEPSNNDGNSENDGQTTTPSEEEPGESEGEGGNTQTAGGNPIANNGDDNEDETDNNESTTNEDDSYADVLALIEELEKQVADAKNKNDLNNATDYRDENTVADKINDLADGTNKTDLQNRLDEINKILNDSEAPVVTPDVNGSFTNADSVAVEITDDNDVTYTLTINGKETSDVDLANLTEEGVYVLKVKDSSFNEDTITFTVDRNESDLTKTTMSVDNTTHFKNLDDAKVEISDLSLDRVVVVNQDLANDDANKTKTYSGEDIIDGTVAIELTEEGTYKITAYDKAGNEEVFWLAVDTTSADINFVGTAKYNYFRSDVELTVFDKFLTEVIVEGPNGNETYTYANNDFELASGTEDRTYTATLTEEGTYKVTAKDKAGNEVSEEIVIDKTKPIINGIENGGVYKEVTIDVTEENVQNIKIKTPDGDTINAQNGYVVTSETGEGTYTLTVIDLAHNRAEVTFTIDATKAEVEVTYSTTDLSQSVTVTLTSNEEIKPVDAGTWNPDNEFATILKKVYYANANQTIKVVDKAGNETEVTITITNIDREAPEATKIRMLGGKYSQDTGKTIWYVNEDSNLTVYVEFAEELVVNPKLDINDITGLEMKLSKCEDGTCYYYYKFSEIEKLNDGFVSIKVYDYSDAAGNVGEDLFLSPDTNQEIEIPGQKLVYIDNTAPTRGYSTLGFEYTDNSDKTSVEINGEKVYYVKPGDSFLYKIAFSEKIQDGLIATIAGTDVSLEYLDYSEDLGYIYGGTYTVPSGLTEGERLEIVVSNIKDLAGNEYVDGTIVDVPTSNGRVAEFDNTPIKYNAVNFYVDNNEYQDGNTYYATYGSTLVAYIRTNELLKENPTFEFTYGDEKIVISGEDVEFIDEEKEEFTYLYRVRYTIPENFEKIEEEVTLNITNIVDYAGNITDNGSTGITNRNRVFIDTLAPQVVELRFNSSNDNKNYANENHSVGIYLVVDEELTENPVFTINGIQYKMTEQKEVANGYFYAATTKLPADTEEGKLSFTITNVVDEFGNSTSFDNDDIKNDVGYNYVIFDTTDPVITKKVDTDLYLPEGSKLPELSDLISATDNIDGDVTANAYIHRYTNEGDYYFLEIYVKDACGNGEYPSSYAAFRIHFVTENNQTSVDSAELSTVSNTKNNEPSNGAIVGAIVNSFSEDCLMIDAI